MQCREISSTNPRVANVLCAWGCLELQQVHRGAPLTPAEFVQELDHRRFTARGDKARKACASNRLFMFADNHHQAGVAFFQCDLCFWSSLFSALNWSNVSHCSVFQSFTYVLPTSLLQQIIWVSVAHRRQDCFEPLPIYSWALFCLLTAFWARLNQAGLWIGLGIRQVFPWHSWVYEPAGTGYIGCVESWSWMIAVRWLILLRSKRAVWAWLHCIVFERQLGAPSHLRQIRFPCWVEFWVSKVSLLLPRRYAIRSCGYGCVCGIAMLFRSWVAKQSINCSDHLRGSACPLGLVITNLIQLRDCKRARTFSKCSSACNLFQHLLGNVALQQHSSCMPVCMIEDNCFAPQHFLTLDVVWDKTCRHKTRVFACSVFCLVWSECMLQI